MKVCFQKPSPHFPNHFTKSQLHTSNPEKQLHFKLNSHFFGTSNAKTQNTNLIGHKTSFPKQQAPSTNSQNRKSYAQNTKLQCLKTGFQHSFSIFSTTTTKTSREKHNIRKFVSKSLLNPSQISSQTHLSTLQTQKNSCTSNPIHNFSALQMQKLITQS